jgi:hypothetical protein
VPPDLRKQIEKSIKDGQRRFDATVSDIRSRVNRAAKQADLDKALKRLDGLSKEVQKLARAVTSRAAPAAPAAKPPPRRASARKPAAGKPAARKAAPKAAAPTAAKPAARRAAPRRSAPAPAMEPSIRYVPPTMSEGPGPVPTHVDTES